MKKNDILVILIPTFLFVIAWITFSVYHNIITSTISEELNMQILPISPNFDTKILDNLKNRQRFEPSYQITPSSEDTDKNASASNDETNTTAKATAEGELKP